MNLKNKVKLKNENNRQFAYRVLKENIMNLNLFPGECISEVEISNELNTSRTPVREAIVKLIDESLIEVLPQKGSFVSKINLKLIDETVFLRNLCEQEIIKLIISESSDEEIEKLSKLLKINLSYQQMNVDYDEDYFEFFKLDNQFHEMLFKQANKLNVWKNIKKFSIHFDRTRVLCATKKTNRNSNIEEHYKIIELIENKNTRDIEKIVSNHLTKYKELYSTFQNDKKEYFKL